MSAVAQKADPQLWERIKAEVTASGKGGKPGQWSARKAQLAVRHYKQEGGRYRAPKGPDNHLQRWQDEDWGTKSGGKSLDTGERYLPKKARSILSDAEYKRTTAKKQADLKQGKQFSAQPGDVAAKTARARHGAVSKKGGPTKAALMEKARDRRIPGRSRMNKAELEAALA